MVTNNHYNYMFDKWVATDGLSIRLVVPTNNYTIYYRCNTNGNSIKWGDGTTSIGTAPSADGKTLYVDYSGSTPIIPDNLGEYEANTHTYANAGIYEIEFPNGTTFSNLCTFNLYDKVTISSGVPAHWDQYYCYYVSPIVTTPTHTYLRSSYSTGVIHTKHYLSYHGYPWGNNITIRTKYIPKNAFNGLYNIAVNNDHIESMNSELESVTLKDTISLGNSTETMTGCFISQNLTEVHIDSLVPPVIGRNEFASTPMRSFNGTIYVPYSADHSVLNAYKSATNWSNFAEIIQEEAS